MAGSPTTSESASADVSHRAELSPLIELVEIMARLRAECGWKAAQTHRTLARHLLEETYETLEAIEAGDPDHLREELGDVLLQVYLHAAIAAQAGEFDIEDVARGLVEKMLRRNPHVFGDEPRDRPGEDQRDLGDAEGRGEAAHRPARRDSGRAPRTQPRRQGPRPARARRQSPDPRTPG